MKNMSTEIENIRSKPSYNPQTGKLIGWDLSWNYVEPEFGCLGNVAQKSRFFEERWFRDSYKAMCRFQRNLLARQNENNK